MSYELLQTIDGYDVIDSATGHTVAQRPDARSAAYALWQLTSNPSSPRNHKGANGVGLNESEAEIGRIGALGSLRASYHRQNAQEDANWLDTLAELSFLDSED